MNTHAYGSEYSAPELLHDYYNDYLQEIFHESQNCYLFCYLDQLLVCAF